MPRIPNHLKVATVKKPAPRHELAIGWIDVKWAMPTTSLESLPVQVTTVSGAVVLARWNGSVWVEEGIQEALPAIRFWRVAR